MKKFYHGLAIFLLFVVPLLTHCGFDNDRQQEVHRVSRALALTTRTFVGFFEEDLASCAEFFAIYDALDEGLQACDNGDEGSFQITKQMADCVEGQPITATAKFLIQQNQCQDNATDIIATGNLDFTLTFSAAGNIGVLASSDFATNQIMVSFSHFQTKVDLANNQLSCTDSQDLIVDVDQCRVSKDCRKCNL